MKITKLSAIFTSSVSLALATSLFSAQSIKAKQLSQPAPELGLEQLLQAPEGTVATNQSLKGKVVVLEFWATWCGPCVQAFGHINHLAVLYKGKDVVFISVTNESAEIVEPFLVKKPLKTWIGIDSNRSLLDHFKFRRIPQTVLINKNGGIAQIYTPTRLKPKHLDRLLAGEETLNIGPPEKIVALAGVDPKTGVKPVDMVLRETQFEDAAFTYQRSKDGRSYTLLNVDSDLLLRNLFGLPKCYIIGSELLEHKHFDLIVNLEPNQTLKTQALGLIGKLGYHAVKQDQQLNSLILEAVKADGGEPKAKGRTPTNRSLRKMQVARLKRLLEASEGMPVVDRSNVNSIYLSGLPKKGIISGLRDKVISQKQLIVTEGLATHKCIVISQKDAK